MQTEIYLLQFFFLAFYVIFASILQNFLDFVLLSKIIILKSTQPYYFATYLCECVCVCYIYYCYCLRPTKHADAIQFGCSIRHLTVLFAFRQLAFTKVYKHTIFIHIYNLYKYILLSFVRYLKIYLHCFQDKGIKFVFVT